MTTSEFNKLATGNFTARLKQVNVATKGDIAGLVEKANCEDKLKNSNKKVTSNISKHLLVENEFKKLQDKIEKIWFKSFYWLNYFFNDRAQIYLIF